MSTIKALLFDLGGVVLTVDFDKVFRCWAKLSSLDEVQISSRFKVDELYEQHERGQIEASVFFEHQRRALLLHGSDDELAHGWNAIFETEISESIDAIDIIRARMPVYGFSNTNRTHQLYWEKHFPRVHATFEKIYVSSEIGLRKPDAEAFQYILNDISIQPDELLFFDDSIENIEGASRLGIQTVLVKGHDSVVSALKTL